MTISVNSQKPYISIVILTFNGEKYIRQLLISLTEQTYPANLVEIIVVDNDSSDRTRRIVQQEFPEVRLVPSPTNLGFAAGNNYGLKHAKYDWIAFLNQDTICHQDWLKVLADTMVVDSSICACNPNIIPSNPIDQSNWVTTQKHHLLHYFDLSPFGYARNRIEKYKRSIYPALLSGCSFLIRREVIDKLGYLFDESLWMYAEDTDLSLRLIRSGHKIAAVRDAVVYHFHKGNPAINRKNLVTAAKAIQNRVVVYFKNMDSLEFTLFFPILMIGGSFKLFEFNLKRYQTILWFIPFSLFSMACMLVTLFKLPFIATSLKRPHSSRKKMRFLIMKRLMKKKCSLSASQT